MMSKPIFGDFPPKTRFRGNAAGKRHSWEISRLEDVCRNCGLYRRKAGKNRLGVPQFEYRKPGGEFSDRYVACSGDRDQGDLFSNKRTASCDSEMEMMEEIPSKALRHVYVPLPPPVYTEQEIREAGEFFERETVRWKEGGGLGLPTQRNVIEIAPGVSLELDIVVRPVSSDSPYARHCRQPEDVGVRGRIPESIRKLAEKMRKLGRR